MSEIVFWNDWQHIALAGAINFTTHAQATLSASTSRINIPLVITSSREIDFFRAYLASGASTTFRCRIVTESATTGDATDTLVHANATATITASAAAWNVFDFTNFTLAPGQYWISLDSTDTPATALAIQYNQDYNAIANLNGGRNVRYWTGSALANTAVSVTNLRAALKAADGWVLAFPLAPLSGASGVSNIIMDTLENPACRGNDFEAPASGKIVGFNFCKAAFTANTSYDFVFATAGCAAELARVEHFTPPGLSPQFVNRIRFAPVEVVAGTRYAAYVTAGSQATTTGGVGVTALDTSEDGGDIIACYGVTPGDIKGLYVHDPPTEGGGDVPTTTLDYVFPWVPVYSEITTSGGGGSSRARARSF